MKCPWTKELQRQIYRPRPDDPKNLSDSEVVTTQFGNCIEFKCPFYDGLCRKCTRAKM